MRPTPPAVHPQDAIAAERMADALARALARELEEEETRAGLLPAADSAGGVGAAAQGKPARAVPAHVAARRAAHALAKADHAARREAREQVVRGWEAYHAAEDAAVAEAEGALHQARLREAHRHHPDVLRALGVPAERRAVGYPQAEG